MRGGCKSCAPPRREEVIGRNSTASLGNKPVDQVQRRLLLAAFDARHGLAGAPDAAGQCLKGEAVLFSIGAKRVNIHTSHGTPGVTC